MLLLQLFSDVLVTFVLYPHLLLTFSLHGERVMISSETNGKLVVKNEVHDEFSVCFFLPLASSTGEVLSVSLEHSVWRWSVGFCHILERSGYCNIDHVQGRLYQALQAVLRCC